MDRGTNNRRLVVNRIAIEIKLMLVMRNYASRDMTSLMLFRSVCKLDLLKLLYQVRKKLEVMTYRQWIVSI